MKSYRSKLISVDRTNNTACVEFNELVDGEIVYSCHHQTTILPRPDFIKHATIECIVNKASFEEAEKSRAEVYEYIDDLIGKTFDYTQDSLEDESNCWAHSANQYDARKALIVEVLVELGLLK